MMKDEAKKILFVYQPDEDKEEFHIESLWGVKEGDNYKIDNIPFFIKNIAVDDVVAVEDDDGKLYFDRIIKKSGHSTIQVLLYNIPLKEKFREDLKKLGCESEGSHLDSLISVNVPPMVNYDAVKQYLDLGEQKGEWEYQEAYLGWK